MPQELIHLNTRRIAIRVLLLGLLLYLPYAGSYGLWDPWETHYGEVARQMTERGDFISLWWPGSPRDQAEPGASRRRRVRRATGIGRVTDRCARRCCSHLRHRRRRP